MSLWIPAPDEGSDPAMVRIFKLLQLILFSHSNYYYEIYDFENYDEVSCAHLKEQNSLEES